MIFLPDHTSFEAFHKNYWPSKGYPFWPLVSASNMELKQTENSLSAPEIVQRWSNVFLHSLRQSWQGVGEDRRKHTAAFKHS